MVVTLQVKLDYCLYMRISSSAASFMHHHMHTHDATTTKHVHPAPTIGDHTEVDSLLVQLVAQSGNQDTLCVDATTNAAATGARTTALPHTAALRKETTFIPDAPAAKPAQSKAMLGHTASTNTQNQACDCILLTNQRCDTAITVEAWSN